MTTDEQAQARELADWEQNQRKGIMALPVAPSAKYCTDVNCGDEIPEARRQAIPGVLYCAECQERREQLQRMRRSL